jgi:transposase InsO family protein
VHAELRLGLDVQVGRRRVARLMRAAGLQGGHRRRPAWDRYDWPSRQALRTAVFDFIEVFDNRQRRHSTLDYHPPVSYEEQHPSPAPAA